MKKYIPNVLLLVLIALIIVELYFLYVWIMGDGNSEPIFTLINAIIIPFVIYFRSKLKIEKESNDSNAVVESAEHALKVVVDECHVKFLNYGLYRVQINLRFGALEKDVFISEMRLKSNAGIFAAKDTLYGANGQKIESLFPIVKEDLLRLSDDEFEKFLDSEKGKSYQTTELQIPAGSWKFFSLYGDINSERLPDGFEDFPTRGWHFIIEFNERVEIKVPFSFTIHDTSKKYPIEWRFEGFNQ